MKNEVVIGQPGKDGKDGTPGSIGLVGPQGPAGEDGQPGKNAYAEISVKNGVDGVDGKHGKDGITRIVYEDENGEEHTVATLEDGLKFAGDTKDVTIAKKLNETLEVKGGISDASLLSDKNIGVVAKADGGLTVKLAKNLDLADGSVTIAADSAKDADGNWLVKGEDGNWYTDLTDAVYDADSQTYTKDGAALTAVANPTMGTVKLSSTGLDNGNQRIVNVATGIDGTDAVNVAQLKKELSDVTASVGGAHTELTLDGKSAKAGADGALGDYIGENNLTMAVKDVNGQKVYDLKLKNEVVIGQPGKDGKDGTPGSIGLVGPQGPAGEDGQPGKNAYGEISVKNGVDGVDGKHGKDGITRIVYEDEKGEEHTVATLEDGLKFAGDTENVTIPKKLNETLEVKGGISDTSLLTDNNIGVVAQDKGGLTVKLAKNLNLSDGSVAFAETAKDKDGNVLVKGEDGNWYTDLTDAVYDADSQTYTKAGATLTAVESPVVGSVKLRSTGLDNGNQRIVNVATGIDKTDAVNVGQLDTAISNVVTSVGGAHTELTLDGKSATAGADGALGKYIGENNLTMAVKDVNGQKVYDLKLKNEVVIGQPGKDGKDGTPGSIGLVGPQGPAGEDGQPGKNAYGEISVKNGVDGVDGKHGKDGITRIVYEDEKGEEHTVATLEDGLKFAGDTENVTIAKKLNETLDVKGGISDASMLTDNNIGVVAEEKGGLTVKLAKNLNLSDGSVAFAETAKDKDGNALVKGEDGNWYTDLTDAVYDADSQTYTKDGATLTAVESPVVGAVKLSSTGLDNGNQRIVNVATGIDGTDAVNVAQLKKELSDVTASVGGAHTELTLDGKSATAGADGELGKYIGENNLTMAVKDVNGQKVYDLKLKNEVVIGQPGKDGKDGTPGSIGLVGPQGPAGEDGQPGKNAYGEISVKNGVDGVDGKHGKDGITRIVYEDENGEERVVATLDDGLKFAGDTKDVTIAKKLNETLEVKGGISDTTQLSDNNIGVVAADDGLTVKLAKNINLNDGSVRVGGTTGEDGTATGGIYISNQNGVTTTKANTTEDGLFITGLSNTDWNPEANGIVESRAATEKQLKAVADSSAKVDAANLSDANVNSWKSKLGITDTLLGEAGAWKLTVNGIGERSIKKDSVINFVNGSKVQITQSGNDITVGLDAEFVKQVGDNTTNITNLDKRVTKVEGDVTNVKQDITKINKDITNINQDITNINTKIETIEGKAGVANVVGDTETGVKVEKVDPNDATKGVKVSLEEKITVGGITIDGTTPSEGETANRTITGLTNTTWDADKAVDHRAATEGQLKDLSKQIKEVGEIKDGVRTYASDDSGDNPLKRKNSDAMELRGGADSDNLSDNNIGVVTNKQKTGFDIKLSKDLKGLNSAEIGNVSISNNITVGTGDQKTVITDNSVTTGNTTINNDGLTIKNEDSSKNITIQTGNVNLGGNAIHNVGEATEANDAINKAQLDRTVTAIGAGMNEMSGRIGSLDRRVDRVGAGAAALAALHPLEYSPDAKWEVTAGLGNYRSTSAVALGAFYRPNYDTLFSIGASYGGGENMVNAGVTWRIGEGETKNYPSKQVMAQEIDTLKSALAQQNDKIESQSEQLEEQNKKIEQLMQAIEKLTK
ncbi:MAG: YadA-like family protein [Megasphaera massiliensis]|uniref:YadA-like family protein n=1 Tax=Megasphaera massiliensis TaxID=1232428 RepID=UPI002A74B3B6|nr:YadA-like family protein [Megasphaera massiliensis]MDY2966074.1 YadA-like family protein [Megasphaera massiliensis]